MFVPTPEELTLARSWIGNTETEDVFAERYDRLKGSIDAAILESLRAQLAVMTLDGPSYISTPDGMRIQYVANITAIQDTIKRFISMGGTDPNTVEATSPGIHRLDRTRYR
jgi:hypothetical protein